MKPEILEKELARIDVEIEKYLQAKERLQAKLISLEAGRSKLLAEFPERQQKAAVISSVPAVVEAPSSSRSLASREFNRGTGKTLPVVTALVQTKSFLEGLDRNIGQTVQTAEEVLRLLDGILRYGSQFRQLAETASEVGQRGDLARVLKALFGQGGQSS